MCLSRPPTSNWLQYLRADRASTISFWQDYLAKYPATSHTSQAKESLVSLLAKEGENDLALYAKELATSPSYEDLRNANLRADQALSIIPNFAPAVKLQRDVHGELEKIVAKGQTEMAAYKKALGAGTPGTYPPRNRHRVREGSHQN